MTALTPSQINAESERLAALRMQMLEMHPFWGYLLLQMKLVPASELPAFAATDAVSHIWFNPELTRKYGQNIFSVMEAGNPLPCCDTLLMLFFGRLAEEDSLGRYMENARRLIYVISEHRGQSNDLRKKAGEPERTIAYLNGQGGIRFSHIQFEEDFSQPLSSREEAIRYITRMYGVENAGKYLRYLTRTDTGYMLPNRKHASIFIIEKEEMK